MYQIVVVEESEKLDRNRGSLVLEGFLKRCWAHVMYEKYEDRKFNDCLHQLLVCWVVVSGLEDSNVNNATLMKWANSACLIVYDEQDAG